MRGPPTQALLGENVCENEGIGSRRGGRASENFVCRSVKVQKWVMPGSPSVVVSEN